MTLNKEQCENLKQFCRTQWQDMMTDKQEQWLTDGLFDFVANCATDIGLDWRKIPQDVAEEICKECYDCYQQTDCAELHRIVDKFAGLCQVQLVYQRCSCVCRPL